MGNCSDNRNKIKPEVVESVLKYVNSNLDTYPIYSLVNKYKNFLIGKSKNLLLKALKDPYPFINFQLSNNTVKTIRLNSILNETKLFDEELPVHKMSFSDLSCSFKPNLSTMEPKNTFSLGRKTFLTIYKEDIKDNIYRNMNNQMRNSILSEEEFVTIYSERIKQFKIVKLDSTSLIEASLPRNQGEINNHSTKINKIKSNLSKFKFSTIKKIKHIYCKTNEKILYLSLHENNCIYAWVISEENNKTVTVKLISNVTHAMLSGFKIKDEDEIISDRIDDFDICFDINSNLEFNLLSNKEVEIIDMRSKGLCYDTEVFMISTFPQHAVAFFIVVNDRLTFHKVINLSFKIENPNLLIEEENSLTNDDSALKDLFIGPVSIYNSIDKEFICLYYTGNKIVKFGFKFDSKINDEEVREFSVEYNQSTLEMPKLANSTIITMSQINYTNIVILYSPKELLSKMLLVLNVKLLVVNNLELVYDDYYKQEFENSLEKSKLVVDKDNKQELHKLYSKYFLRFLVEKINNDDVFSNKNVSNLSTFNKLKYLIPNMFISKGNHLLLFNLFIADKESKNINELFSKNELTNVCINSVTVINLKDISKSFGFNQEYHEIISREIEDPNDKEKKTKIPMILKYKIRNVFNLKQIFDKIKLKELNAKINRENSNNSNNLNSINENSNENSISYLFERMTIGNN